MGAVVHESVLRCNLLQIVEATADPQDQRDLGMVHGDQKSVFHFGLMPPVMGGTGRPPSAKTAGGSGARGL